MSRTKRFTAFFLSDSNTPATGLSPTITIYNRTDSTTAASGVSMTEVGNGLYEYELATYDYSKDYLAVADGTATLTGANRYVSMGNESYVNDIADKMSLDHGAGQWDRAPYAVESRDLSDEIIEKIAEKVIKSLPKPEKVKTYTLSPSDIKKTVEEVLNRIADEAESAIKRIERPKVNVTTEKVEVVKEVVNVMTQELNISRIIKAINDNSESTNSIVRKNIDGMYEDLANRLEEQEEAERKKVELLANLYT